MVEPRAAAPLDPEPVLAAGLPTATIAEFQSCVLADSEGRSGEDCQYLADRLRAERERIDAAIADLETNRAALDDLIPADSTL